MYEEGEVVVFSARCWDHRTREDLIESKSPFNEAQVAGLYQVSNPVCQLQSQMITVHHCATTPLKLNIC